MQIKPAIALEKLKDSKNEFLELFNHGSLAVEVYKPNLVDKQSPHDRDEIYVVISGSGEFINGKDTQTFGSGDVLFVPAGTEHRFNNFTNDFSTWVFFYGPKGGEAAKKKQ